MSYPTAGHSFHPRPPYPTRTSTIVQWRESITAATTSYLKPTLPSSRLASAPPRASAYASTCGADIAVLHRIAVSPYRREHSKLLRHDVP